MKLFGKREEKPMENVTQQESFAMVTQTGEGFTVWNGRLYKSDIIRACIRPKAKAIGKLEAKHVRISETPTG